MDSQRWFSVRDSRWKEIPGGRVGRCPWESFLRPRGGKTREIDLVATMDFEGEEIYGDEIPPFGEGDPPPNGYLSLALSYVVECKKTDTPWIVFCTSCNDDPGPASLDHLVDGVGRDVMGSYYSKVVDREGMPDDFLATTTMFEYGGHVGHAVTQAYSKRNVPWEATQQVLSAAIASAQVYVARLSTWFGKLRELNDEGLESLEHEWMWASAPSIQVVLPLIVLEGQLFEWWLTEDGAEVLRKVQRTQLYVHQSDLTVLVPIVTTEFLPEFAKTTAAEARSIILGYYHTGAWSGALDMIRDTLAESSPL